MKNIIIGVIAGTLIFTGCTRNVETAPQQEEIPAATQARAGTVFIASGNEPFWNFRIEGKTATYITPDNPDGTTFRIKPTRTAKSLTFTGKLNEEDVTIVITRTRCKDDMSGQKYPMTATFFKSDSTFGGCAEME